MSGTPSEPNYRSGDTSVDIILTGIARSGTTLSCALLNKLPQCIALHEPMNPGELVGLRFPEDYMAAIDAFFSTQRADLLAHGMAVSKARGGAVPDNPFPSIQAPGSLRPSTVVNEKVDFRKALRPDFRLVIKHPNLFTATLATLQRRYQCYAIVRNPLATLLSWQTIQAPVQDGRLPFGEAFDAELKADLADQPDRLGRQLIILRWYYSRYASILPRDHVIQYENLVASGGRALAVIDPDAAGLDEQLENRNASSLYDAGLVCRFADRLLADDAIYRSFYSAADIENLRQEWTRPAAQGGRI